MNEERELWWVSYHGSIGPAEVDFRDGKPYELWFIGNDYPVDFRDSELIERLIPPGEDE